MEIISALRGFMPNLNGDAHLTEKKAKYSVAAAMSVLVAFTWGNEKRECVYYQWGTKARGSPLYPRSFYLHTGNRDKMRKTSTGILPPDERVLCQCELKFIARIVRI